MRECQQCGERNQDSSRFCVICGSPLPEGQAEGAPHAPSPLPRAPLGPPPVIHSAPLGPPPVASPGGTGRPNAAPLPGKAAHDIAADIPVDAPRTLVGFLVSFDGFELGQYWPLHQGKTVVGREGAASGLDIEIDHPTTSSLHAVMLAASQPGRVAVEDMGSTNGTFVNDNPLATGQRWELRDGDRLRFGLFETVIKIIER